MILFCFVCFFQGELSENSDALIDIFKPLDGKNIEEIEDATSSVLSNSNLKVRMNNWIFNKYKINPEYFRCYI